MFKGKILRMLKVSSWKNTFQKLIIWKLVFLSVKGSTQFNSLELIELWKSGHYTSEWDQVEGVQKLEELAASAEKEQRLLHFDERNTKKIWTHKHFFVLNNMHQWIIHMSRNVYQANKVNFNFMLILIKTDPTALSNSSYFAVHKPICGYNRVQSHIIVQCNTWENVHPWSLQRSTTVSRTPLHRNVLMT